MTAKHTQGPVYLVSVVEKDHERQTKHVHNIFNRDGLYAHIAECWNADNARRIVAAWNACQGIPTEVLEAQQSGGLPWPAWQPIETAPKDGTVVLARIPDSDVQQAVMWSAKEGCWVIQWDHWKLRGLDAPTHWMRLPEVE